MVRGLLALLVVCAVARADRPPVGATSKVDRVVATVNGTPIWQSQIDEHLADPASTRAVLDEMIDEELVVARARARYVTVEDAEVDAAITEIKTQNQLDDAGLDAALAAQHYTRARYRVELARQLLRLRVIQQELGPTIQATDPVERRAKLDQATTAWIAKLRAAAHIERRP
jgi:peptidyl-prolyl cis-trans isomerase SurA